MSNDGTRWTDKAKSAGPLGVILMLIGGPLVALGEGISTAAFSMTQIYTQASNAIADGASAFIRAFSEDPAEAFGMVIRAAADSFQSGPWAVFGPLQMPMFAALIILTAWQFLEFLDRRDSDIPFTGMDVPLLGNDSDGEED